MLIQRVIIFNRYAALANNQRQDCPCLGLMKHMVVSFRAYSMDQIIIILKQRLMIRVQCKLHFSKTSVYYRGAMGFLLDRSTVTNTSDFCSSRKRRELFLKATSEG